MKCLDVLRRDAWREVAWIAYLNAVVIDGKPYALAWIVISTVTQCIGQRLTQGLHGYLKMLLADKPPDAPVQVQVLEAEGHAHVQQLEDVAALPFAVDELLHVRPPEARHPKAQLRKRIRCPGEQGHGGIDGLAVLEQLPA